MINSKITIISLLVAVILISCSFAIGGEDLKKLGIKPGPPYKKILTKVLHKKIDGKLKKKKEEIDFVKKII